jgi:hypothetical protein
MTNERGAMFAFAWLLEELTFLRFLSSSGIDSNGGPGLLDAILSVDQSRSEPLIAHFHDADTIAEYVYRLKKALLGEPLASPEDPLRNQSSGHFSLARELKDAPQKLGDSKYLHAAVECAKTAIRGNLPDSDVDQYKRAAKKWGSFWNWYSEIDEVGQHPLHLVPDFEPACLAAAPYYINGVTHTAHASKPILRIEDAFSKKEYTAFKSGWINEVEIQRLTTIPGVRREVAREFARSCYLLMVRFQQHQTNHLSGYLPLDCDSPSFCTVGLDPASGTLSFHLKPVGEIIRQFSLTFPSVDPPSESITDFVLDLTLNGFDLRTLFDRHQDEGYDRFSHTVEFTADVKGSAFGLQYLGNSFATAFMRRRRTFRAGPTAESDPSIHVSQPFGVAGVPECLDVVCACVNSSPTCTHKKFRFAACEHLRGRIATERTACLNDRRDRYFAITVSNGADVASCCFSGLGKRSQIPFDELSREPNARSKIESLAESVLRHLLDDVPSVLQADLPALQNRIAEEMVARWDIIGDMAHKGLNIEKEAGERFEVKPFEIALSYPRKHRPYVEEIAKVLAKERGKERVFYDVYYEATLARPNLDLLLQSVYHNNSILIVAVVCKEYGDSEWCGLEFRAIRDLIKIGKSDRIMLVRMDQEGVEGIFGIDGFVDAQQREPADTAALILQRLKQFKGQ